MKILSFSGGRTSGFMLHREIERNKNFRKEFIVIFCNTGKERNETLNFVNEVQNRWHIPIVWLEYCRVKASTIFPEIFPTKLRQENHIKIGDNTTHWFKIVDFKTASCDGTPFNDLLNWLSALPNVQGRSCSAQLKIRTAIRYCFSIGLKEFDDYIGIRNDEAHRAIQIRATCEKFLHPIFPLIEDKIIVSDVMQFWKHNDFDLRLKDYEGNCDLCFLKAKWKLRRLIKQNPERAIWWINKERERAPCSRSASANI
jgi:hypothetical protein